MKHLILAFAVLLLLVAVSPRLASPVFAAGANCVATPTSGPPGTTFQLAASGFDRDARVFMYAVDPGGTAFSDPTFNGFGGPAKANEKGVVNFSFVTRFEVVNLTVARALGPWTLVVQQLGPAGAIVHESNCTVTLTRSSAPTGATLAVNPTVVTVGNDLMVTGGGFAPFETVNLWATPPPGCSSFAFSLPYTLYQYSAANAYSQDDVKANGKGEIAYPLPTYSFFNCQGDWSISAYAPGSKVGAYAGFRVISGSIRGGLTLLVKPATAMARGGSLGFDGSGYTPGGVASCWLTRPEGTVRFLDNYPVRGDGTFSFIFTTGFDDEMWDMHYSEGSGGHYAMTCRDNAGGASGVAAFTLLGMPLDP